MANNIRLREKINRTFGGLDHKDLFSIIKNSFLSEKTVALEEKYNIIVLKVDRRYNKQMIKLATESVFTGAKVIDVNTINYKSVKKNFRGHVFNTKAYKKAYIRLTKDSEIELGENQTAITKFTGMSNNQDTTNQTEENK